MHLTSEIRVLLISTGLYKYHLLATNHYTMFVTAHEDLEDICGIIKNIEEKSVDSVYVNEDKEENFIPTTVLEKQTKPDNKVHSFVHQPTYLN